MDGKRKSDKAMEKEATASFKGRMVKSSRKALRQHKRPKDMNFSKWRGTLRK